MRYRMALAAMTTIVLATPAVATADQLMCNRREVAKAAADMLREGTIVIDFCSQCEDRIRVVRVRTAAAVEDCKWELEVAGRVVWESDRELKQGEGVKLARYRRDSARYLRRLDLAYAYVEVEPNDFRWLGGLLGLSADVNVASLRLPTIVSISLGRRPLAQVPTVLPSATAPDARDGSDAPDAPPPPNKTPPGGAPKAPSSPPVAVQPPPEDAPAAPDDAPPTNGRSPDEAPAEEPLAAQGNALTTAMVAQVFDYWRTGSGEPVLGHFVACLKLDLKRGSKTRYECVKTVDGPVERGTKVYGWSDWLVPRDADVKDVALEFVYGADVRLRKPLALKGRAASPMVPTIAAAKLSQRGIYTLRLTKGGETVREVQVEVR